MISLLEAAPAALPPAPGSLLALAAQFALGPPPPGAAAILVAVGRFEWQRAWVDEQDLEAVEGVHWYVRRDPSLPGLRVSTMGPGHVQVNLASYILRLAAHTYRGIRYANGNPLDCRRCNLVADVARDVTKTDTRPAWERHLAQYGETGPRVKCPRKGEMAPQHCANLRKAPASRCPSDCPCQAREADLEAFRAMMEHERMMMLPRAQKGVA